MSTTIRQTEAEQANEDITAEAFVENDLEVEGHFPGGETRKLRVATSDVVSTDSRSGFESRWTLYVGDKGVVEMVRTIPYDGQRVYSTLRRQNRADTVSKYSLDVEAVLDRYLRYADVSDEEAFRATVSRVRDEYAEYDPEVTVDA